MGTERIRLRGLSPHTFVLKIYFTHSFEREFQHVGVRKNLEM